MSLIHTHDSVAGLGKRSSVVLTVVVLGLRLATTTVPPRTDRHRLVNISIIHVIMIVATTTAPWTRLIQLLWQSCIAVLTIIMIIPSSILSIENFVRLSAIIRH